MENKISQSVATEKKDPHKALLRNIFIGLLSQGSFLLHMLISFTLIFILAYFFGYELITVPLSGNDALNSLSYIVYLAEHFPRIPLWYPYQGGGVSATLGYPQFYSYVVILLSKITGLTFVSSMGIVNFLSLLLPACGVYLFVATRLKSLTGGLIAGILYLFSPMAYVWIWGAGFLAQTFSVIFVPFFLIFFDWLLDSTFRGKMSRLALILTVVFGMFSFFAHPATLMGLFAFMGLYTVGRIALDKEGSFKSRFIKGVVTLAVSIVLILSLSAAWLFPLRSYTAFANRDITVTLDTSVFAPLNFLGTLGLLGPDKYPWGDFSIYAPIWIMALVGVILGFFFQRKVTFLGLLAFASIYFAGSTVTWQIIARVSFFAADFFTLRPWYPLSIVLNPIAAAMGAVLLARLFVTPLALLETKQLMFPLLVLVKIFRRSGHFLLTIIIIVAALYILNPLSGFNDSQKPWIAPIGPNTNGINLHGIWNRSGEDRCAVPKGDPKHSLLCDAKDLEGFEPNTLFYVCDNYPKEKEKPVVCKKEKVFIVNGKEESVLITREEKKAFIPSCFDKAKNLLGVYFHPFHSPCLALGDDLKSQLAHWPLPELIYGEDDFSSLAETFNLMPSEREILTGRNHRIDITPHLGTTVKAWVINNKSSMLNAYTGQLSLIKTFYSIFNDNMYDSNQTPPQVINNLAHYFGTEAVVVISSKSPMESFAKAGWERVGSEASVVFPPFKTGLVSIGPMPKVLIIGSKAKGAYKQVFRSAVAGAVPFEKGILVEGPQRIGDITSSEISKFDLVILQGYDYKNRNKDIALLKKYIEGGGAVFIDTGWQYVSPDWGREKRGSDFITYLPEPFPVEKTTWGGVGKDWENSNVDNEFSKDTSASGFGPLMWQDSEWSVSSATKTREWAKSILSKEENILIAGGEYGKGRIVWSGMNILAHAEDKKSEEERKFLANIFSYLLSEKEAVIQNGFTLSRPIPEKLVIRLERKVSEGETLYFREAFYPTWHAYALSGEKKTSLAITSAGPSFMITSLPALNRGDSVVFEFKPPRQLILGMLLSLLTIGILFLLIVDKLFMKGRLLAAFLNTAKSRFSGMTSIIKSRVKKTQESFAEEEEEY